MPRVILKARAGLRYEGVRYAEGDTLDISDAFLANHPTRFEVVPPKREKKQRKKAPIIETEAPKVEVIRDADNTGDNSGL